MNLVTLRHPGPMLGMISAANQVIPLPADDGWPANMIELIGRYPELEARLQLLASGDVPRIDALPVADVTLDAPIRGSEKLICIGKNYVEHALEMGGETPELPVVFSKFASAIIAHKDKIVLPEISQAVDYEAELVVVIGKPGKQIPREKAWDHVFGYCCGNDISARDWQKGRPGGQWLVGKTFDTFAPLGPMIVTADQVPNPHDLRIQLRLNGETMQDDNTQSMIFRIDELIAHVSQFVTLVPGDLLFTGTPAGVGAGRTPPLFLKAGDRLEVEISRLGILANRVVANAS